MTLTHELYEELLHTPVNSVLGKTQLSKLCKMRNDKLLIYAVSLKDGTRQLYFELSDLQINKIPLCKGISISEVYLPEYNSEKLYGEINQTLNSENYIFEIIVEDIRKNVFRMNKKETIQSAVIGVLRKWKDFFAAEKSVLMSKERQQGMYGELKYLEELLDEYGGVAVNYWAGCKYETHDFYINSNAVEVKTTSTKEPYKIHISSENQLDKSEIKGELLIRFYALRKSESDGETLEKLIRKIKQKIAYNITLLYKFENDIEQYGYYEEVAMKYTTGYTIRECKTFRVNENFPCITKQILKNGISNCTYDLLTISCINYEIDKDETNMILRGVKG